MKEKLTMKKLILVLLVIFSEKPATFAQSDSTLKEQYRLFKKLEFEQYEKAMILEKSLFEYFYKQNRTGKEVASEYIDFANKAIERWKVVLDNPEVLFADMETLEVVEMVKKHTREDQDAEKRIEELKEKLRAQIREHIQKLSEDIRELSG